MKFDIPIQWCQEHYSAKVQSDEVYPICEHRAILILEGGMSLNQDIGDLCDFVNGARVVWNTDRNIRSEGFET